MVINITSTSGKLVLCDEKNKSQEAKPKHNYHLDLSEIQSKTQVSIFVFELNFSVMSSLFPHLWQNLRQNRERCNFPAYMHLGNWDSGLNRKCAASAGLLYELAERRLTEMTWGCLDVELRALIQRFPDREPQIAWEKRSRVEEADGQKETNTRLWGHVREFRQTAKKFGDMEEENSLHQRRSVEPLLLFNKLKVSIPLNPIITPRCNNLPHCMMFM